MAEFVSIGDLPSNEHVTMGEVFDGDVPLVWGIPMPAHLDTERIQVNATRMSRLHSVGAFSSSIVMEYQGDTSESHCVAGINSDGSAVAGKSKNTKKADNADSAAIVSQKFTQLGLDQDYGRGIAHHKLNRPELIQNVINQKSKGKSDEEAWATCLDDTLRESFRLAGKKHLMMRSTKGRRVFNCSYTAMIMGIAVLDASQAEPSASLAVYSGVYAASVGADLMVYKKRYGESFVRDRRWSVCISDIQPDRYLSLNALSRFPGLVTSKR